jgi:flavorubredoxin
MKTFIHHLTERNYQSRTVALIENGTWAPNAAKVMRGMLEGCKNLTVLDDVVTIRSAMNAENREAVAKLAQQLA